MRSWLLALVSAYVIQILLIWIVNGRLRIGTFRRKTNSGGNGLAQEFKPGEIVSQSGIYTITHDPVHADMPHEVTVIKGRRFPTCRHCKGISFELAHAAKHVGEIDHLDEAHAPAQ